MPGFTRRQIDNTPATDSVEWMPELGATVHQLRSRTGAKKEPAKNYWSVFTVLVFNEAVFLFTGDADKGYEASFVSRLQQLVKTVHVLKVTHHGSSDGTSPNLVQAFPPAIAFASTAEHDTHQLEDDVRKRLGDAAIYTTYDGAARKVQTEQDIIIRTDGQQRTVEGVQGIMFEVWRRKPALRPLKSAN
jgi:beta-lactamase superfamily II metal-dependent hydrolase